MLQRLGDMRPRTLAAGAAVTVVGATGLFLIWPMPAVEEIAGPILDTRWLASGSDAAAYLDALGEAGRRRYTILAVGDLLWAIVHGLTAAAAIAVGVRRSALADAWSWLSAAALAYLVLDVAENSSILAALAAHPDPAPVPAGLLDLLTAAKFVALGVAYLAAVAALAAWWRAPSRAR